jgi:hypothetical protein
MIESRGDSIECINPGQLGVLLAVKGPGTVTPALMNVSIETVTAAAPSDGLMTAIAA